MGAGCILSNCDNTENVSLHRLKHCNLVPSLMEIQAFKTECYFSPLETGPLCALSVSERASSVSVCCHLVCKFSP